MNESCHADGNWQRIDGVDKRRCRRVMLHMTSLIHESVMSRMSELRHAGGNCR